MIKNGRLFFNYQLERYDIRFNDGNTYGGLHCGDCIEVLYQCNWKPTRIEFDIDWYFVDLPAFSIYPYVRIQV